MLNLRPKRACQHCIAEVFIGCSLPLAFTAFTGPPTNIQLASLTVCVHYIVAEYHTYYFYFTVFNQCLFNRGGWALLSGENRKGADSSLVEVQLSLLSPALRCTAVHVLPSICYYQSLAGILHFNFYLHIVTFKCTVMQRKNSIITIRNTRFKR